MSDRRATAHLRFAADAPRRERSQERYPATTLRDADRQRMPREEARRSPGESDEGAASRPQGQNVPCAGDFAAASGTDRFRACADSAGLAPDGVYAYAERGDGRRSRQPWSGSTVEYRPRPQAEPPKAVARGVRNRPHADKAATEGNAVAQRRRATEQQLVLRGTSKTNRLLGSLRCQTS